MTTPITPTGPSKAKTYIALAGGVTAVLIPYLLAMSVDWPQPWPIVLGVGIAVLTGLGVYHGPYTPGANTVDSPPSPPPPPGLPPPNPATPHTPWPKP